MLLVVLLRLPREVLDEQSIHNSIQYGQRTGVFQTNSGAEGELKIWVRAAACFSLVCWRARAGGFSAFGSATILWLWRCDAWEAFISMYSGPI